MILLVGMARLGLCCAAVTIGAAALSHLHPALDSLGVWLLYGLGASALGGVLLALARRWASAGLAAALLATGGAQALPHVPLAVDAPVADLTLLQHNLKYLNDASDLAVTLFRVDVATLQEVRAAAPVVAGLAPTWNVHTCPGDSVGGQAVLSRLPVLDAGCIEGGAWSRVETASGPVTILSMHLKWPWPFGQNAQLSEVLRDLALVPRPILVAGDFNQTPWSHTMDQIMAATGARPLPGLGSSFTRAEGLMRVRIDHVLVPEGWGGVARTVGKLGSDHQALRATLGGAGA